MEVKGLSQGGQNTLDYYMNQIQNSSTNDGEVEASGDKQQNAAVQDKDASVNTKDIDENKVKNSVDKINKLLEDKSTHLVYEAHDSFKHDIIIKIVDNKTNEVVREIPPRKLLDMVAKLCELAGVFINQKA
jgi:flagellar protein FlaG